MLRGSQEEENIQTSERSASIFWLKTFSGGSTLHKQSAWMATSLITLTVTPSVRIALRVFAMGTYVYSVGDAETEQEHCMHLYVLSLCSSKAKSSVI